MRRTRAAVVAGLLCALLGAASAVAATPTAADRKRVVVGTDGYLFSSQDWTVPCQDRAVSATSARLLVELGEALQAGGRRPVVTIGPDKSTIHTGNLPATVPDRACHAAQHAALWRTATSSPYFLDLRRPLQQALRSQQVYYRKDTHWSHGGDAVYARSVLRRLDPLLALAQGSRTTTGMVKGDLASVLGLPPYEKVQGRSTVNPGVTVTELPARHTGMTHAVRTFRAVPSAPGARVLPGRTVLVGDSFTAVALQQLVPLSEETVFVWIDSRAPLRPLLDELAAADRVVVESVERFATRYRLFRQDVVDGVRALPPRPRTVAPSL